MNNYLIQYFTTGTLRFASVETVNIIKPFLVSSKGTCIFPFLNRLEISLDNCVCMSRLGMQLKLWCQKLPSTVAANACKKSKKTPHLLASVIAKRSLSAMPQ